MITFDSKKMSDDEWHFIRFYCAAVSYDYDLLQIIRALVSADFRVKPFYAAVELGLRLYELQQNKMTELSAIGKKHGHKLEPVGVPTEFIAEVFTQSFFKIIDSETKSVLILDKNLQKHDGWSSGHPADWQDVVHTMQEIHAQKLKSKNTAESIFISALFKLFSMLPPIVSDHVWPQAAEPDDEYYEYDDDEYDSGPDYPL